jgi:hypothetical protein
MQVSSVSFVRILFKFECVMIVKAPGRAASARAWAAVKNRVFGHAFDVRSPLKPPPTAALKHLHRTTVPQLSLCLFKRIPDNCALVMVGALPVRFF